MSCLDFISGNPGWTVLLVLAVGWSAASIIEAVRRKRSTTKEERR